MADGRRRGLALALAVPLALVATPAAAHQIVAGDSGLLNGILHPFASLLIAPQLLAAGLLLQRSRATRGPGLVLFAVAVAGGAAAFTLLPAGTAVFWLAPATGMLAAGLTALDLAPPAPLGQVAAVVLGLALGYVNGDGVAPQAQPLLFLLGLAAGSAAAVFYVGAAIERFERPWVRIAVRAVASWVVALDLMLIGLAITDL